MTRLVAIAGMVMVMVCGCAKTTETTLSPNHSRLTLNDGGIEFSGSEAWPNLTSKSDLEYLPSNTKVGLYVVQTSATPSQDLESAQWKNEQFVSNGIGALESPNTIGLWVGETYQLFSYAPRKDAVNARAIPVSHGEDILWSRSAELVATPKTTSANLTFMHRGAQIAFQLKSGNDTDLSNATLQVTGFYRSGSLDLKTGLVTVSDPSVVITDKSGQRTNVLVDGRNEMTLYVQVANVPDRPEPMTGTLKVKLEPGTSYLYDVKVNFTSEEITFIPTVKEWEDVVLDDDIPLDPVA